MLYLPPRMPDPRSPEFAMAAGRQVVEILKRTRGRAFVLFTSYATLRAVQAIAEMALDYPIFVQGTAPRTQLLRQFRATPHSVLFATSSFWQGVDVVGDALSCVIIDKLPFASPGDPITAARIDAIRAQGGEPFDEYQVPLAILALQQGWAGSSAIGKDRGVLAVLDPRLRTKGYGRRFIASLPPAPVVHDLAAVEALLFDRVRYELPSIYCFLLRRILWSAESTAGPRGYRCLRSSPRSRWPHRLAAQSTGMVKGVVTDDKGQPVEGAKVTIEMNGGTGRRFETKTNKKGEYIQIGLDPAALQGHRRKGQARIRAGHRQRPRQRQTAEADMVLGIASAAASKEAQAKNGAAQEDLRRRRRAQHRRQARRGDREVQRGDRRQPDRATTATTTSATATRR